MPRVPRPEDIVLEEVTADAAIASAEAACCPSCEKLLRGGHDWDESPYNPANAEAKHARP